MELFYQSNGCHAAMAQPTSGHARSGKSPSVLSPGRIGHVEPGPLEDRDGAVKALDRRGRHLHRRELHERVRLRGPLLHEQSEARDLAVLLEGLPDLGLRDGPGQRRDVEVVAGGLLLARVTHVHGRQPRVDGPAVEGPHRHDGLLHARHLHQRGARGLLGVRVLEQPQPQDVAVLLELRLQQEVREAHGPALDVEVVVGLGLWPVGVGLDLGVAHRHGHPQGRGRVAVQRADGALRLLGLRHLHERRAVRDVLRRRWEGQRQDAAPLHVAEAAEQRGELIRRGRAMEAGDVDVVRHRLALLLLERQGQRPQDALVHGAVQLGLGPRGLVHARHADEGRALGDAVPAEHAALHDLAHLGEGGQHLLFGDPRWQVLHVEVVIRRWLGLFAVPPGLPAGLPHPSQPRPAFAHALHPALPIVALSA
mmetsp:Transcript_97676/g.315368  ORF Transcript_97676/g.315368 Transcript_97676/m.315368 type:complete len:423 (+) Transcript_97676:358-1626(+)